MFKRLFRRSATDHHASPLLAAVAPLSDEHRRQTDTVLACLVRHGLLFDDEFDADEVYDHVRCNGPEDPGDAIGFEEVIGSVAHTLEPLTNLVFIPIWSELTPNDVEEFTESICWLAGINTNAVAAPNLAQQATQQAQSAQQSTPPKQRDPAETTAFTIRFELDPGQAAELEVQIPPKGIPDGLIDGLAELLDDRLGPRQIVEAIGSGDCVVSALDPAALIAVNDETRAGYGPSRVPRHPTT